MSIKEYSEVPLYVSAMFGEAGNIVGPKDGPPIWSGKFPPPAVGEKVNVRINGLGPAEVKGYFSQDGYLGLLVVLDNAPEWYVKQNGDAKAVGHVFGIEVDELEAK